MVICCDWHGRLLSGLIRSGVCETHCILAYGFSIVDMEWKYNGLPVWIIDMFLMLMIFLIIFELHLEFSGQIGYNKFAD